MSRHDPLKLLHEWLLKYVWEDLSPQRALHYSTTTHVFDKTMQNAFNYHNYGKVEHNQVILPLRHYGKAIYKTPYMHFSMISKVLNNLCSNRTFYHTLSDYIDAILTTADYLKQFVLKSVFQSN